MQELKFALRSFIRTPGASGLMVMTLAVAIAAATIIASTIDMVWRFIPAVRTDRLVFVASTDPKLEQSRPRRRRRSGQNGRVDSRPG